MLLRGVQLNGIYRNLNPSLDRGRELGPGSYGQGEAPDELIDLPALVNDEPGR